MEEEIKREERNGGEWKLERLEIDCRVSVVFFLDLCACRFLFFLL